MEHQLEGWADFAKIYRRLPWHRKANIIIWTIWTECMNTKAKRAVLIFGVIVLAGLLVTLASKNWITGLAVGLVMGYVFSKIA